MSHPRVFHVKSGHPGVYVARKKDGMHFGNPFTHKFGTLAAVVVSSRAAAVQAFQDWLDGEAWYDIEQDRRQWILEHLHELIDQDLLCFCCPELCHAEVLAKKAQELKRKQNGEDMSKKQKPSANSNVKTATDAFLPTAGQYETPEGSCGKCKDAALDFERLARAMGIKCYTMQVEAFKGDPKGIFVNKPKRSLGMHAAVHSRDGDEFAFLNGGGYGANVPAKDFVHNINFIKDGDQLFFVDWTARQFDEKAAFPAIMTKEQMMALWEKSNEEQILAISMD